MQNIHFRWIGIVNPLVMKSLFPLALGKAFGSRFEKRLFTVSVITTFRLFALSRSSPRTFVVGSSIEEFVVGGGASTFAVPFGFAPSTSVLADASLFFR